MGPGGEGRDGDRREHWSQMSSRKHVTKSFKMTSFVNICRIVLECIDKAVYCALNSNGVLNGVLHSNGV